MPIPHSINDDSKLEPHGHVICEKETLNTAPTVCDNKACSQNSSQGGQLARTIRKENSRYMTRHRDPKQRALQKISCS
jgi:hypothetical protein